MTRIAVLATILLLASSAAASAAGRWAQVRTADGALISATTGSAFRYPADGSVVTIASVRPRRGGAELEGVFLLGGRVRADVVHVGPGGRGSSIQNLVVDGLLRDATQNSLYALDSSTYVVVLQRAELGTGRRDDAGVVGLRLSVAPGYPGLPRGAEVLVGVPSDRAAKPARARRAGGEPWAVLGFAQTPLVGEGVPFVAEPLLGGTSVGARAVAIAMQYLGVPYVWAGEDPQTGFDCSGLTMYVYGKLGIRLTHFSGAQFNEGIRVPRALLQPGDLVFFHDSPVGPGHMGMYVGNGQFIHAPRSGDVVKISSLASYGDSYVGAVRPVGR